MEMILPDLSGTKLRYEINLRDIHNKKRRTFIEEFKKGMVKCILY